MRSHSAPSAFCRLSTTLYFALMFCTAAVISSPAQSFTTLASFSGSNGIQPFSAMTQGPDGNVYGMTQAGGNLSACGGSGCGTVFKVTPTGTLTVIYSFSGPDGDAPEALVARQRRELLRHDLLHPQRESPPHGSITAGCGRLLSGRGHRI